jgi:hypothetical protein
LPDPQPEEKRPLKQDAVIAMLRRPEGATVDEVASATGWQLRIPEEVARESGVMSPAIPI